MFEGECIDIAGFRFLSVGDEQVFPEILSQGLGKWDLDRVKVSNFSIQHTSSKYSPLVVCRTIALF